MGVCDTGALLKEAEYAIIPIRESFLRGRFFGEIGETKTCLFSSRKPFLLWLIPVQIQKETPQHGKKRPVADAGEDAQADDAGHCAYDKIF